MAEPEKKKFEVTLPSGNTYEVEADNLSQAAQAARAYETRAAGPPTNPPPGPGPVEESELDEQLRAAVTPGRMARSVARGGAKAVIDQINTPNIITETQRAVVDWGREKAGIPSDPNNPDLLDYTAKVPEFPRTTSLLPQAIEQPILDFANKPEFTQEELRASPGAQSAQAGRRGAEWMSLGPAVRGLKRDFTGAAKNLAEDIGVATVAGTGSAAGGTPGELLGGISGTLFALRSGQITKLDRAERAAFDFLISQREAGQSVDDVINMVDRALSTGEAGSLSDLAGQRGFYRAEEALRSQDRAFDEAMEDKGIEFESQTQTRLTDPLRAGGEAPPRFDAEGNPITPQSQKYVQGLVKAQRDEALRAAEAARDETLGNINRERQAFTPPERPPAEQIAQTEQARTAARTEREAFDARRQQELDTQRAKQQEARDAEAAYVAQNPQRLTRSVPENRRAEQFEDFEVNEPLSTWSRVEDFWDNKAFSEIKSRTFKLDEKFRERVDKLLADDDTRIMFNNYLNEIVERTRRAKGEAKPDITAEDFDLDAWQDEILSGEVEGVKLMALRNFFARQANRASDEIAAATPLSVRNSFDNLFERQLEGDDLEQFIQTKEVYPTYLSNQRLMNEVAVVLEEGRYDPKQAVTAQKPFGYPERELDVEAYQAAQRPRREADAAAERAKIEQEGSALAKAREREAAAQQKTQQQQLKAATTGETKQQTLFDKAEKQAERDFTQALNKSEEKLSKSVLAQYVNNPAKALKSFMKDPDGTRLREVFESIEDPVARNAFKQEVASALIDELTSASTGKLQQSAIRNFEDMQRVLVDSGIVTGEQGVEMAQALQAIAKNRIRDRAKKGLTLKDYSSETAVASSILAALMMNASPGSSLILAGVAKRVTQGALRRGLGEQELIEVMERMFKEPQYFLDLAMNSKSQQEAANQIARALRIGQSATQTLEDEEEYDAQRQ